MNCGTCLHWKKRGEFETGHSLQLGQCKNVPMLWDSTKWSEDGESRVFSEESKDLKAFVQDGSDYKAELLTLHDFGCVSFVKAIDK